MKIGIMIGQIVQIGGVCIAAIEEVRNFRKLGHDSEFIVLRERKNFQYEDFAGDIPIRFLSREFPWWAKLDFKIPLFSFFSFFHFLSYFTAPKVIKEKEYDLLIVHETYDCFSALALKKKRKIPFKAFIWDPISYILPRVYKKRFLRFFFPLILPLGRWLDKKIIKEAEEVFVCSDLHKEFLEKMGAAGKIKIVYPGCYPLKNLPATPRRYLLALTKWDIGKNPFFLLEVLKRLSGQQIKLIVAGNWVQQELREEFLKAVKKYGLDSQVEMVGRVDSANKIELFSGAVVLIHPIVEAFGMMCLEAAGCGCPSIIPRRSGVTNLFEDGIHGFFPEEGDLKAYVKYLDKLIGDEHLLYQMGKQAWEIAKQNTWLAHSKRLINLIHQYGRAINLNP